MTTSQTDAPAGETVIDMGGDAPGVVFPPKQEELIQVAATIVHLLDSAVSVDLGNGLQKLISYQDFLEFIRGNLNSADGSSSAQKEFFPPNGTFYFSVTDREIRVCTYHPEGIMDVNYRGNVKKTVVPNIIISFILAYQTGGTFLVTSSRYYATRDPLGAIPRVFIDSSAGLPVLPFTNVYEDGRLCFGSGIKISTFRLPDLRGLHSFYQLLFDAPFNDDLGLNSVKRDAYTTRDGSYSNWYNQLAELAKKGEGFPYNKLRAY